MTMMLLIAGLRRSRQHRQPWDGRNQGQKPWSRFRNRFSQEKWSCPFPPKLRFEPVV